MSIRRLLVPACAAAVLSCVALVADAQTGPVGGPKKDGGGQTGPVGDKKDGQPGPGPAGGQKMTPERVAALLKDKGFKATMNPAPNAQSGPSVAATITQDGWQYNVDIKFTPNMMDWYFSSALTPAGQTFTQEQLLGLMKKNWDYGSGQVFGITNDNRLYLETPNYTVNNIQDQTFFNLLNTHTKSIKDTYNIWGKG
jgi:hypothetical protein